MVASPGSIARSARRGVGRRPSPAFALCLADLHSNPTALARLERRLRADRDRLRVVLAAGDITIPGHEAYAADFVACVQRYDLPLLVVHGNNDTRAAVDVFRMAGVTIHRRERELCGRRFVGFGGDGHAPHDVELYGDELETLPIEGAIFLTHIPPAARVALSPIDRSGVPGTGASGAPEALPAGGPVAHICGHIHHTEGIGSIGGTKVIKLRAAMWNRCALLDLDSLYTEFLDLDPDGAAAPRRWRPTSRPAGATP